MAAVNIMSNTRPPSRGDSTMRTTTSIKTKIALCVAVMLGTASTGLAAGPYGNPSELQQCAARLQGSGYGSVDSDNSFSGYDMAVGRCMEYINRPHAGQPRRSW
jgi:hypothetical protein